MLTTIMALLMAAAPLGQSRKHTPPPQRPAFIKLEDWNRMEPIIREIVAEPKSITLRVEP